MKSTGTCLRSVAVLLFLCLVAVSTLSGCGGGGITTVAGGGTGGTGVSTGGISGFGSTFLNGIRYDDSAADIVIDGVRGQARSLLAVGMRVTITGPFDDSLKTGSAEVIEVKKEARGRLDDNGIDLAKSVLSVMGQTILVTPSTVFDNVADLADLKQNVQDNPAPNAKHPEIEVYGARDDLGRIHATYIRKGQDDFAPGGSAQLRGTVSALAAGSFQVGATRISFTSPVAGLANGAFVEVRGTFATGPPPTITASSIEVKAPSIGNIDDEAKVEGYVLSTAAGSFRMVGPDGEISVLTDARTQFENGSASDIVAGTRLTAEGTLAANGLVAGKVVFRKTNAVRLEGRPAVVDPAARTLTLFTKTVSVDGLTQFRDDSSAKLRTFGLDNIVAGADYVRIAARLEAGGTLVASLVERVNPPGDNRNILQGTVEAKDAPGATLTILGLTVFTDPAAVATEFRGGNGSTVSPAAFFAAVTPGSTVVKVRYLPPNVPPPTAGFAKEVEIQEVNN